MALTDVISRALEAGIAALDDVPESPTYTPPRSAGDYDAEDDTLTTSVTPLALQGAVFARYREHLVDGMQIRPGDLRMVVIRSLNPEFTPEIEGTVEREGFGEWNVVDLLEDPARTIWIVQLRQVGKE